MMKQLAVVARAASRHRSCCCSRRVPRFDPGGSRAIATSQPRRDKDDKRLPKILADSDLFLPDGSANPKYNNPRAFAPRFLPKGLRRAAEIREEQPFDDVDDETAAAAEEEDTDGEQSNSDDIPHTALMDEAYRQAEADIDNFDGPGGTNVWGLTPEQAREMARSPEELQEKYEPGFFALDEEKDDPGEDPEFDTDDITSDAHGELEQHREMREFARVIAWDMPLLWNHRKAFEPPTAATPLRFRYTTYLGETHPASRKVVVDFSPSQLPDLTPVQLNKLIKLLGARYNPSTETARMSCEMFSSAAQNKRYLGDLVGKLLTEARDPTDTFEDVPFDFRHHKVRPRHEFPEKWNMTDERREELARRREEKAQLEAQEVEAGRLVDGGARVQGLIEQRAEMEPVMVPAGERARTGGRRTLR